MIAIRKFVDCQDGRWADGFVHFCSNFLKSGVILRKADSVFEKKKEFNLLLS